ncbi:uncharacterized protein LOC130138725 [Syzygium oleosum]|uniref:uncharacterized protein LOC130138725 n=1 Tax=Syzygium oleosum TaxID=219896 RepID=UPI0024BB856E|nr:uncharacterized protein LOC130138725 [Syzygium oleosum]
MSNRRRGTGGRLGSRARVAEDPRVDGILRALEEVGILMGRQNQERAATVTAAAEAVVAAANGANGNSGNNENNGNNGNGGHPTQGQVNANKPMSKLVEQFLKPKPPRFDGRDDTKAAPRWVEELEKTFEVLGCTDEEKVTLAVYQLQGNASDWWRAIRGQVFSAGTTLTWTIFTKTFNGKYFSKSAREQKLVEFMRPRQGQMSVDQYEAEFARLSKFAPRMVEDPVDKARRFRDGLKPDLRS